MGRHRQEGISGKRGGNAGATRAGCDERAAKSERGKRLRRRDSAGEANKRAAGIIGRTEMWAHVERRKWCRGKSKGRRDEEKEAKVFDFQVKHRKIYSVVQTATSSAGGGILISDGQ